MKSRESTFQTKFSEAATILGVKTQNVISIKLRDGCSPYREYQELINILETEYGLNIKKTDAELQGNGFICQYEKQKVVAVEHETGLEILYIAGSVASLIGLIPIILDVWNRVKGFMKRLPSRDFQKIEIRRIIDGKLFENKLNAIEGPSHLPLSVLNVFFSHGLEIIDEEMNSLRKKVEILEERLSKIENSNTRKKKNV